MRPSYGKESRDSRMAVIIYFGYFFNYYAVVSCSFSFTKSLQLFHSGS